MHRGGPPPICTPVLPGVHPLPRAPAHPIPAVTGHKPTPAAFRASTTWGLTWASPPRTHHWPQTLLDPSTALPAQRSTPPPPSSPYPSGPPTLCAQALPSPWPWPFPPPDLRRTPSPPGLLPCPGLRPPIPGAMPSPRPTQPRSPASSPAPPRPPPAPPAPQPGPAPRPPPGRPESRGPPGAAPAWTWPGRPWGPSCAAPSPCPSRSRPWRAGRSGGRAGPAVRPAAPRQLLETRRRDVPSSLGRFRRRPSARPRLLIGRRPWGAGTSRGSRPIVARLVPAGGRRRAARDVGRETSGPCAVRARRGGRAGERGAPQRSGGLGGGAGRRGEGARVGEGRRRRGAVRPRKGEGAGGRGRCLGARPEDGPPRSSGRCRGGCGGAAVVSDAGCVLCAAAPRAPCSRVPAVGSVPQRGWGGPRACALGTAKNTRKTVKIRFVPKVSILP